MQFARQHALLGSAMTSKRRTKNRILKDARLALFELEVKAIKNTRLSIWIF